MSEAERILTAALPARHEGVHLPPRMAEWPSDTGAYALIIALPRSVPIPYRAGREVTFARGFYIYTGSALGPGGLRARIGRHLSPIETKRPHWHIDRLLEASRIAAIWWEATSSKRECAWAAALAQFGRRWPSRFGASDCGCAGHLIQMPSPQAIRQTWTLLKHEYPAIHRQRLPSSDPILGDLP